MTLATSVHSTDVRQTGVVIVTVPCLDDNYAFLVHDPAGGRTALVDAPEAAPIRAVLAEMGWRLDDILLTHHHADHVGGLDDLREGARVIGAAADAHRLPPLELAVAPGDALTICGQPCEVIAVPGHTLGHLAYAIPGAVFTGDSLMALGCGRLFEGSADQMWDSLSRLAALPGDTLVCSGHEYAAANARFALTVDPTNAMLNDRVQAISAARGAGQPTVPSTLSLEQATNPFLRADRPAIRAAAALPDAPTAQVFAAIRAMKDTF